MTEREMFNRRDWRQQNNVADLFEARAAAFSRQQRDFIMAPGKSVPLAIARDNDDERRERFDAWRSAMGPSDSACNIAVELRRMREDNE